MTGTYIILGVIVLFLVIFLMATYMFGRSAFEQFRTGTRKRALFFGVIAGLAALGAYCLFRLFVERTYGAF